MALAREGVVPVVTAALWRTGLAFFVLGVILGTCAFFSLVLQGASRKHIQGSLCCLSALRAARSLK